MVWGNFFPKVLNHRASEFTCLLLKSSYTFLCSAFQRHGLSCGGPFCQDDLGDLGDVCYHLLARSYQSHSRISRADYSCLVMIKLFLDVPPNLCTEVATDGLPDLLYVLSSGMLTF